MPIYSSHAAFSAFSGGSSTQRRGFAASGRAGKENEAVRLPRRFSDAGKAVGTEPEFVEGQKAGRCAENSQDDGFPVGDGDDGNPEIDGRFPDRYRHSAVLGEPLFQGVQVCHDFYTVGNRQKYRFVNFFYRPQDPVDAVADMYRIGVGLDMNIRRFKADRLDADGVDDVDDRRSFRYGLFYCLLRYLFN
jgi:hypothetical protein